MKQNRHFIFTVAALLFGFALSAKAEEVATIGGTGTESDPYTIGTLEQLEAFRNSVNAGETTYNAPGVWVALTDDIDLAGTTWERGIGDGINATYDGIFDGKNHAVKNLNMTLKADEVNYLCGGLFGYTYGAAAIKNLVIENANITFTAAETGKQYHNVGILVGFANNKGGKLNVDNVTVKGDIKVDVPQGYGVGAIVGYSYRAMGAITNTKVTASNGSYIKGERFVGGITGYSYNDAIISNCSVENLTITASKGAAGIAGLALSGNKITGCSVVNTTVNGEANVAYIVGELGGEGDNVVVEDCTAPQPWVGGSWETDESFVATIGTKYYTSLATAVEAAGNGETITLISDFSVDTETYTIAEGKSITLDMNGKTITVTDNKNGSNYELFYVLGELTVTGNGTIELTATYDRDWNAMSTIFHNRGGVLTIENGTFKHLGGTDMAYVVDNSGNHYGDATTNINGGELSSTYIAIRNRMEQNTHGASGKAILNVTDGIISGTSRAIWAQAASTSTTSPATGEINISGGTIGLIDTPRNAGAESMTTISGGTVAAFKGEVGELTVNGDGTITGSVTILSAAGNAVEYLITDEGLYALAVAKIGDVKYRYLDEAFAVQSEETITLLEDATIDNVVIVNGNVILDMNGKKIVRAAGYEGDAFEVYGDLNLLNATEGCVDGAIGHVINDADYKTAAYAVTPKSVDKVTYNRTFGHTEWQVLYLPFAVPYEDFKDAFAAYTISGVEDDCVKLVEVTEGGVVEANTPCLVKAHAVGAVTITVEDVELAAEENSLTVNDVYTFAGTCSPMDAEALKSGSCYVLSGGSWMQLAESNTTAVLGAFRVYLTISEATAARSFSMRVVGGNNEDGTTAIEPSPLAPQHEADVIYDLLGRRVTNLTQGIFIVNGKKVVIR